MRLIDAEALLNFMEHKDKSEDWQMEEIVDWVEQQPTIEAKLIAHAHWEEGVPFHQCSNCNGFALSFDNEPYRKVILSNFCPHCGAQMDERVSDTNKLNSSEKPNSSVKIPVISMEDVPKLMEEKE